MGHFVLVSEGLKGCCAKGGHQREHRLSYADPLVLFVLLRNHLFKFLDHL